MPQEKVKICPRCGKEYNYIETRKYRTADGSIQEYRFAVHVYKQDGRRRKKRCSLGPVSYIYSTETQTDIGGMTVRGALVEYKLHEYLDSALSGIKLLLEKRQIKKKDLDEIIEVLEVSLDELKKLRERLGKEEEEESGVII